MDVLLTSGDGHQAAGLAAMRQALIEGGLEVITIAPAYPPSSPTAAAAPESARAYLVGGGDRNPIYSASGSSIDCVRMAIHTGLIGKASVVISGVGEESALGPEASYSATFSAAIEAASLGYPAIAVSQVADAPSGLRSARDFRWAGVIGAELAAWMSASTPPCRGVVNVNIPASLADRRLKLTSFASRPRSGPDCVSAGEGHNVERPASLRGGYPSRFDAAPNSDAQAIAHGHVSITPVDLESPGGRRSGRMANWVEGIIRQMEPRLGVPSGPCSSGCCG